LPQTFPSVAAGTVFSASGAQPSISVSVDVLNSAAGGLASGTVQFVYDTNVFQTVNAATDVHLGALPAGGSGWTVNASDNVLGVNGLHRVLIVLTSGTPITSTEGGVLATVDLTVKSSAPAGATNLLIYNDPSTAPPASSHPKTSITDSLNQAYSLSPTPATTFVSGVDETVTVTPSGLHLVFPQQPSNTTAGESVSPSVTVAVEDSLGNVVTTDNSDVTVALGTNPGSGTLSGTLTVAAVSGVATFGNLSINKTGIGYTLTASDGSDTGATSSAFNITPGTATQVAFATQPSNTSAGATISPAVSVKIEDSLGNVVTGDITSVTVALGTNPSGGSLSGTTTLSATNGVATFATLAINKAGIGYTLTASDGGLTGATSSAFNVTPASASQLVFGVQPTNTPPGATISPAVTVKVEDSLGNVVTGDSSSVTVAIGNNPGSGTLSGTSSVSAVSGVATFSTLSINKAGIGYTLTAQDGSLTVATSSAFNITSGSATQLVFGVQPGNTTAGATISPAVTVKVEDSMGNVVTSDSSSVTVALGTNPGGGTLSGMATVSAVSGVATFSTLSINKSGIGYTLTAADGALTGATSSSFNITPGSAAQLAFGIEPTNTPAGATISPAVTVAVEDSLGNVVTSNTSSVTVALGANPGGGTLSGTATLSAASGVATFSTLSINKAGNGYTLTASDGSLTGATSSAFNITLGAAFQLVFGVQPTNTTAGATISPAVTVKVEDSMGNLVTGDTSTVTVAIGANPGGGTLSGSASLAAVGGIATFSTLSIDKSGVGYTLTASDGALAMATSSSFNITPGTATQLAFGQQPTTTAVALTISPAATVQVEDSLGNVVSTDTSNVTVAIGTNPSGATLGGTTMVAAVSGVATFGTLSLNKSGVGYTLTAADGALTGATSSSFNITSTTATQLAFDVEPSNTTAGRTIAPAVTVLIEDSDGNIVSGDNSSVTLALGTNPGGGALAGIVTVMANNGVATFSDLSINKVGTGYTLTAADGSLTGATSSSFNVTPGLATQLVLGVQPSNTTAGSTIAPAVTVKVEDTLGNVVTTDTSSVTVAIGSNPGGGTLGGTATLSAVSGVATFSTLSINKVGVGYTLTAGDGGLVAATSSAFNITAGTASQLAFGVQPSNTSAGTTISPAVTVLVEDSLGNLATGDSSSVTVAIGNNPGSGTLTGNASVSAVSGVATFSTLSINKSGTGYTLTAHDAALTAATSSAFNITSASATQLVFGVQPGNTAAGTTISPAVTVKVEDSLGNVVTSNSSSVTLALGTNPGGGTLSGTTTVSAVSGVATFSTLSINKTGTGYTLTAADGALTGATSSSFNITPGTAARLVFGVEPTSATAGATIAPAVTVKVEDSLGNVVTGDTSSVTVALGTNPGGGTLSGTTTVSAVSGVATFSTLSINKTGIGYTLTAADSALTGATSSAFNITPGTASELGFGVQPSNTDAGETITPAVNVQVLDSLDNVVTTDTSTVTVAIGSNPGSGTLSGTATLSAVSGVATFSTLSINKTGIGYTLTAADDELTGVTSSAFNIMPGTPTQVAFGVQPSNTSAGATISPAVTVKVEDSLGNVVTTDTSTVSIAIGTNPGSGTLSGSTAMAAVSGVATFANLSINKAGTGYTLTASDGALTTATSQPFNIVAGTTGVLTDIVGRTAQTGQWFVGKSNRSGFDTALADAWNPSVNWQFVQTGDFNGDGHADIAGFDPASGGWWVGISDGHGHFTTSLWGSWSPNVAGSFTWVDVLYGDLTGNGKTDIIGRVLQTGSWFAEISNGTSFKTVFWDTWSPGITWIDTVIGNLTGSGRAAVAGMDQANGQWWASISGGNGGQSRLWDSWSPGYTWLDVRVGDLTGNGMADIIGMAQQTGQWWASISQGQGASTKFWDAWDPNLTWLDVRIGDLTGDGKADIIGMAKQTGQWWASISQGNGASSAWWDSWSTAVTWVDVQIGDFNGDGKADITGRALETGQWFTGLSSGTTLHTSLWDAWSTGVTWVDVHKGKSM
jgi:hypothetical protein